MHKLYNSELLDLKWINEFSTEHPHTMGYVLKRLTNRTCNRCGSIVLIADDNRNEYKYQCMYCDENLYSIETTERHNENSTYDIYKLLEQTNDILEID